MKTITTAGEALNVKRVFGDPIAQDGLTIIPVAKLGGGGGGGDGSGPDGQGEGSGSGFGVAAKPVGVYVIKGGDVSWQPSVDVNRAILGGQVIAIVALLTLRAIFKARAKS
jgi:uncharacterized spore protein YtfJ